ncbi:hypothetical protein BJX63DRAFT_430222 [Aspergillus granulosus]|uniref:Uncharacterized protein n=1 Tax=Aspergillus granulosus TaxID=176169 RepID=A0ABR4HMC3_9EURO
MPADYKSISESQGLNPTDFGVWDIFYNDVSLPHHPRRQLGVHSNGNIAFSGTTSLNLDIALHETGYSLDLLGVYTNGALSSTENIKFPSLTKVGPPDDWSAYPFGSGITIDNVGSGHELAFPELAEVSGVDTRINLSGAFTKYVPLILNPSTPLSFELVLPYSWRASDDGL